MWISKYLMCLSHGHVLVGVSCQGVHRTHLYDYCLRCGKVRARDPAIPWRSARQRAAPFRGMRSSGTRGREPAMDSSMTVQKETQGGYG